MRRLAILLGIPAVMVLAAPAAFACGGLVAPNGAVNLLRTTTLAAYVDGVEHYVTSFQFSGAAGGEFGSIVPLPGVPSEVERGGDWTLQRLQREVAPPAAERGFLAASADSGATVLLQTRIDALDITVLKGGGDEVVAWAKENGFQLSEDAPEVLGFYADRSPIFMAAKFDADAAAERGFGAGDGTPIHLSIPTPNPWVPLRILALGKPASALVEADVFLLTERTPTMLPAAAGDPQQTGFPQAGGIRLALQSPASRALLDDLASDRGMEWLPRSGMWLSHVRIDAPASEVTYDLAVDATGAGTPSWVAAGLADLARDAREAAGESAPAWLLSLALSAAAGAAWSSRMRRRAARA